MQWPFYVWLTTIKTLPFLSNHKSDVNDLAALTPNLNNTLTENAQPAEGSSGAFPQRLASPILQDVKPARIPLLTQQQNREATRITNAMRA